MYIFSKAVIRLYRVNFMYFVPNIPGHRFYKLDRQSCVSIIENGLGT